MFLYLYCLTAPPLASPFSGDAFADDLFITSYCLLRKMWLVVIWSDSMITSTSHHQPNPDHLQNLRGISEVDFTQWKASRPVQPKSDFRIYPDVTQLSYPELLTFTAAGCRAGFLGLTRGDHCDAVMNPGIYMPTFAPGYLLDWTLPRPKLIEILGSALLDPNDINHGKLNIEDVHLFYYLRYYSNPENTTGTPEMRVITFIHQVSLLTTLPRLTAPVPLPPSQVVCVTFRMENPTLRTLQGCMDGSRCSFWGR